MITGGPDTYYGTYPYQIADDTLTLTDPDDDFKVGDTAIFSRKTKTLNTAPPTVPQSSGRGFFVPKKEKEILSFKKAVTGWTKPEGMRNFEAENPHTFAKIPF